MKRILMTAMLLAAAGVIGCNQSERGGKTSDRTPGSSTFRVNAPVTATTIKQGDKHTVKLTVDRGKDFKEAVTLKADPSTGLSVDLDPKKVKPGDPETVTATVSVGKEAALGDHKVKVTATPETGNATEVEFKVKVEKKTD
jgi:uncharacterized membrane protein